VSVAWFPLRSVTVQVTVVAPTGKAAGASFVTDATPQLSAEVAVPSATPLAEHEPLSALTVTSPGAVIVGGIAGLSVTTTF
jgi:hypothetical protein